MMPFSLSSMIFLSGCWWNHRQCSTTKATKKTNKEELFVSCWPTLSQMPIKVDAEHLWVWHHRGARLMEYRNGALVLQDNRLHCFHIDPEVVSRFPEISEPTVLQLTPGNANALSWSDERGKRSINVTDLRVPVATFDSNNAMLLILPD